MAPDLREYVRGRLAPYKCPRWIEFRGKLPRTPTGKRQRFRLRELAPRRGHEAKADRKVIDVKVLYLLIYR